MINQSSRWAISRKRWVIIRDGKDIFCGLARDFKFKPIDKIGDTSIKTYLSKNKAISSFNNSWHEDYDGKRYKAIEVTETINFERSDISNEETN